MANKISRTTRCLLLALFGVFLLTVSYSSYGQDTNASLSGTVTDPSNAVIPGAKLVLTYETTGFQMTFTSDAAGQFTFRNLTPGKYDLNVTASGFKSTTQKGIGLAINQAGRVDVHLPIGKADETVTVIGDASLINYENPTIEGGVSPETLQNMPLTVSGAPRSAISLAIMLPGVSTGGGGNAYSARINGGIVTGDEALLDGATMTEGYMNQSGMVSLQGDFQMSPDMVSEVKVLSANYDAQYGNSTSGQLIVVSKGGGEQFHGAGFEFLRNDYLNATQYGTAKKSADKENNYGANIGGPIWLPMLHGQNSRMKGYFYFNWEAFKDHGAATQSTLSIASTRARKGDFSNYKDAYGNMIPIYDPKTGLAFPDNQIDTNREDSVAKSWLAALPTPSNDGEINNYVVPNGGQGSLLTSENVYMSRVDLNVGDSDHFYYTYWRQYSAPNTNSNLPISLSTAEPADPENAPIERLNWEHVFSPMMTNHLTFGYLNRNEGYYSLNAGSKLATVTGVADSSILPQMSFNSNYSQLGDSVGPSGNSHTTRPTYALNDVITRVHGPHTIKAGFEWRNAGGNITASTNKGGTFTFNADTTGNSTLSESGDEMASFFLGASSNLSTTYYNVTSRYPRQMQYGAHIGDVWRVNPKLTLSYSLRWDYITPFREKNNHLSFFDPDGSNPDTLTASGTYLSGRLAFAGDKYGTASYGKEYTEEQHKINFSPRVGFSYSPDAKTVVRAGYGIYFGQAFYPGWAGGMNLDGFNKSYTKSEVTNGNSKTPALYLQDGFTAPTITSNIDGGFDNGQSPMWRPFDGNKRPYSSQWNLTLERELPSSFFLAVSYVGTKGTHLPSRKNPLNVLNPFSPQFTDLASTPFTSYSNGVATTVDTVLKADYNQALTTVGGQPYSGYNGAAVFAAAGISVPYVDWNNQVSSCGATGAQALLPYPQYCSRLEGLNEGHGNSIYNSFQARIERHFKGGLYMLGSLTISKMFTDATAGVQAGNESGTGGTQLISPYEIKRLNTLAEDNVPATGSIAVVYDLPFGHNKQFLNSSSMANVLVGGWQVSPVIRYEYGIPLSFHAASCNVVGQTRQGCLPGVISGQKILLHGRNGFNPAKDSYYINPNALESSFTKFGYTGYGDPVTTVYGPSFRNLDMSLTKNTKIIKEKANFQFRVNFFNAFNNHYFISQGNNNGAYYGFNTQVGSNGFGKWNGTVTTPRTIQAAARIEF